MSTGSTLEIVYRARSEFFYERNRRLANSWNRFARTPAYPEFTFDARFFSDDLRAALRQPDQTIADARADRFHGLRALTVVRPKPRDE